MKRPTDRPRRLGDGASGSAQRLARLVVLVALVVVPGRAAARPSAAVATVVNCRGKAELRSGTERRPVRVGRRIRPGDVLRTSKRAVVWVAYRDGQLRKIGPGSRIAFRTARRKTKKRGLFASLLSKIGLFDEPSAQLGNSGGGIRPGRRPRLQILRPRRSYVLSDRPQLRWNAVRGASSYRVKVASISEDVLRQRSEKPALSLSKREGALTRGRLYFLTVTAVDAAGRVIGRDQTTFTVAPKSTYEELEKMRATLHARLGDEDRFSYELLLAELYLRKTFFADALAAFSRLNKRRPGIPLLSKRIARIHRLTGVRPAP